MDNKLPTLLALLALAFAPTVNADDDPGDQGTGHEGRCTDGRGSDDHGSDASGNSDRCEDFLGEEDGAGSDAPGPVLAANAPEQKLADDGAADTLAQADAADVGKTVDLVPQDPEELDF